MELIELQRGTKVMRALKGARSRLEAKYTVRILKTTFHAIIDALKAFYSSLAAPDESEIREKAKEILDRACKLVVERFTNCAYEGEFYEKQNQLCRALVDVKELCRDYDNPDSWDWLTRAKRERDEASIFLADFLARWDSVLDSSVFPWICRQEKAHRLRVLENCASKLERGQSTSSPEVRKHYCRFVDRVQRRLILQLGSLLTVTPDHAWEVVSSMTDIPLVEFVPCISAFKEAALHKTKQRVVDQDDIVDGVFEILVSRTSLRHKRARPRGLFLLVGQSGVGCTDIAKAVAEHWYGDVSRLVEIDVSQYDNYSDPSRSKCEVERFRNCLTEVVRKRPYSVILLDEVNRPLTCLRSFLEALRDDTATDEGYSVDFSRSIIFMASKRISGECVTRCTCLDNNLQLLEEFKRDPVEYVRIHDCSRRTLKTALSVGTRVLGAELLDSMVDRAFLMNRLHNMKAVCRMLLREIVREVPEGRFIFHISDAALNVVLWNSRAMFSKSTSGKALKEMLVADVRPLLAAASGCNNVVVYVDVLVGTGELSFRTEANKRSLADCYFKHKDGTFGGVLANLRIKMQSAYKFFELRKQMKGPFCKDFMMGRCLLYICKNLSSFSPLANSSPNSAFQEGVKTGIMAFDTAEEKEKFENMGMSLTKVDKGPAKATCVIINAVAKIIGAPLEPSPDDFPARCYLFLCLHDDAKRKLISCLTESLKSYSGKSFFTYIELKNNCRGHEIKRLLIKEVKERPCAVFMFGGVEYADDVLYRSLLEIFDDGALYGGEEGYTIDFRKAIIILTSEAANRHAVANLFDCQPGDLCDKDMNQQNVKRGRTELIPWVEMIEEPVMKLLKYELRARVEIIHRCAGEVKRFRTELLHRVGEIILLNPTLPECGDIRRLSKCKYGHFMNCSANAVSSSVLVRMFECGDRDDAFFDWIKKSPTRFHLSETVGDICELV
ncbi:hypothetical protein OROHE_013619 [Orobanche hederae]